MQNWRWDQGRIIYFQYDVLKAMASVLLKFNGKNVNDDTIAAQFKKSLIEASGLPFLPNNYKVNRNYSRVFQCSLLATTKERGTLVVSDICRRLGGEMQAFDSPDEYFMEAVNRFRYPFPAFQDYDNGDAAVYPFCAILKFLIALCKSGREASVTLDDIAGYIIGNNCTGLEDADFYSKLKKTDFAVSGDRLRQLRELVTFISQLSFLKIFNKKIYLDVADEEQAEAILKMLDPIKSSPLKDRVEEFEAVTTVTLPISLPTAVRSANPAQATPADVEFTEGKKRRAYHLITERSPMLRRLYIKLHPEPVCDACGTAMRTKYPWTDYMLDIHHLLPLASVVRTIESGTSLSDMVGLCPSCHRAIHSYYSKWLKANGKEDFRNRKEAMEIYLEAIKEIA